jgi:hypothetical protein
VILLNCRQLLLGGGEVTFCRLSNGIGLADVIAGHSIGIVGCRMRMVHRTTYRAGLTGLKFGSEFTGQSSKPTVLKVPMLLTGRVE